MNQTRQLSAEAQNLGWLLNNLVTQVPGVTEAVVFSADGLPMAVSDNLDRESAERFSAVASATAPPSPWWPRPVATSGWSATRWPCSPTGPGWSSPPPSGPSSRAPSWADPRVGAAAWLVPPPARRAG